MKLSELLSVQLGLTVAVGILVTSLLTTGGVALRAMNQQSTQRSAEIQAFAQVLAANLSASVAADDRDGVRKTLRSIRYAPNISFAEVVDDSGRSLANIGHHVGLVVVKEDSYFGHLLGIDRLGGDALSVEQRIMHAGQAVGHLRIAGDTPDFSAALRSELGSASIWAVLSVMVGVLIALFQQRRIVRPIGLLTARMAEVERNRRIPDQLDIDSGGEVAVLVGAYNTMIGAISARDVEIARHREHLEEQVEQRTQELRAARDEAEAATEAKSRFLATMTHEIRTPLNGVLAMADLLARSDLQPAQKNYADVIARSGRSLLELLNEILDLSKLEAERLVFERIPVDPDTLVNDSIAIFMQQASDKGLAVVGFVHPDVPASFTGDPLRLRQCLTNLIGNAVKFTESGHVFVSCELDRTGPDPRLQVTVADSGPGIAPERQAHIFEAFVQEDQSTTRRHGGTGLGLAITAQLAAGMGGGLGLESEIGKGSRFSITLPCETVEPAPSRARHDALRIAVDVGCEAARLCMTRALGSRGVEVVADCDAVSPERANSRIVCPKSLGARSAVPTIMLLPLGCEAPREALRSGTVRDLLPQPCPRREIDEMLMRIAENAYRGLAALGGDAVRRAPASVLRKLRVLVADDAAVNQQVFRDTLGALGIEPVIAADGDAALREHAAAQFDLVFLDGNMPLCDGFDAARTIRRREAESGAARLPLILATAQAESASGQDWREAGFDALLTKPFRLADLERIIDSFVDDPYLGPGTVTASLLDRATIDNLHALDAKRPGALARIMGQFCGALPGAVGRLRQAVEARDADQARKAAHALKSMCASAGARGLAERASDLEHLAAEDAARGCELRDLRAEAAAVEADVEPLMAEVEALCGQESATGQVA